MITDMQARKAKCTEEKRQIKLTDGHGLYLLVNDRGGKYWRMDYRYNGKRKTLSIGVYPEVSLSDAREQCVTSCASLERGVDPNLIKAKRSSETFAQVATEWIEHRRDSIDPKTTAAIESRMKAVVFPAIGESPPDQITAPIILAILRKVEQRGTIHTAHKIKRMIGQAMRYAIATGRATYDPTPSLKGALKIDTTKSRPALLDPAAIGGLMRAIDGYPAAQSVKHALDMLARVFCRPGEIRLAQWNEIDTTTAQWRIPAERMKLKDRGSHIVPLSKQVIAILDAEYDAYSDELFVFPGCRPRRSMSDNTLNMALRSMGYDGNTHVAHGFRAMARSLLAEHGWPIPAIERQLAHAEKDRIAQAYARAEYLEVRTKMMQAWSDYLDVLKNGGATDEAASVLKFNGLA